jgi:hypothetical protein
MKIKFYAILLALMLGALPLGVAFADAKGPSATQFGPISCEDGSQIGILINPSNASFAAQDAGSTRVGVVFSVSLFAPDGSLLEAAFDKPGNQPTVWCTWVVPGLPSGFYFGGDVLITPVKP